jgi:hypothetical protein
VERQHKHRDLWVAVLAVCLALAGGTPLTLWAVQQTVPSAHIHLWPNPFIVAALIVFALGVYMSVALIFGWWLPGGFSEDAAARIQAPSPVDPAQWVASCDESDDHTTLMFNIRHRFGNPGAIRAFSEFRCGVTDPGGVRTESVGQTLFRQYRAAFFPGAPPVRDGKYNFTWEGRDAKGAWQRLAEGTHDVAGVHPEGNPVIPDGHPPASEGAPLTLTVGEPDWTLFRRAGYIIAIPLTVTSTTSRAVQMVGLGVGTDWQCEPGDAPVQISDEHDRRALSEEARQRRERNHYGPPFPDHELVPPGGHLSGWLVTDTAARPWTGGRPRCTIKVEDGVGNKYVKVIAQVPPRTYES